ncbi:hypothetical protein TrLO_g14557 [Triparma laevis f. longispina]|uniref:Uncharacterized protein n=1 Tax=Triparma laevis f. longispina TaxID=1714387 RepID=A0A9W7FS51_9STRA|nr:hypothetical protein TrLO_g14557 [Triparma laevis f. longispina]
MFSSSPAKGGPSKMSKIFKKRSKTQEPPPPSQSIELPNSEFPTPNTTPVPSPARGFTPKRITLRQELDPFNVSASASNIDLGLDDPDAKRLLHDVSMSYTFPCKYWLRLTPIILLTSTFSSIITSLALRSYKPYDGSAKDYHKIWEKYFINSRYIDLTREVGPGSPVDDFTVMPTLTNGKCWKYIEGFCEVGEEFTYTDHGFVGTEVRFNEGSLGSGIEVPAKWNEYGATISDVPGSVSLRPLYVIDVTSKVESDASYVVSVQDILDFEEEGFTGEIAEGSVVAFRSGWGKKYNTYTDDGIPSEFSSVSLEALKFLHMDRKVLMHGVEPLDTDSSENKLGAAWLAHNNRLWMKGLARLDEVPQHGCLITLTTFPLKGLTSGNFGRHVAICPDHNFYDAASWGEKFHTNDQGGELNLKEHPLRRGTNGVMVVDKDADPTEYCKSVTSLGCDEEGNPVWE